MEDNTKQIESLLEKGAEYGKTSLELAKLKFLDEASNIVSTLIPHTVVFVLLTLCMMFFNFALAFWLGEILGKIFYGFLWIAAFYCFTGIFIRFIMHKRIKKLIRDYIIKKVLK